LAAASLQDIELCYRSQCTHFVSIHLKFGGQMLLRSRFETVGLQPIRRTDAPCSAACPTETPADATDGVRSVAARKAAVADFESNVIFISPLKFRLAEFIQI
jgi:hypothetical protein